MRKEEIELNDPDIKKASDVFPEVKEYIGLVVSIILTIVVSFLVSIEP